MEPKPLRILIVEDNPFDVLMAESILERLGLLCLFQHATRLDEGVKKAAAGADLVLLDLHLPDAGLADSLAAIARFPTPVVVLTGDRSPASAFRAGRAGALACLSKFSAHSQLLSTVLFAAGCCAARGLLDDHLVTQLQELHS